MSNRSGSPARTTRSDTSWWGDAEFGPPATIQNSAVSWPSATSRSRTSRARSASVRPTRRPAIDRLHGPVRSGGGRAQQLDLLGVLDLAQRAHERRCDREPGAGQRGLEPEQERGAQPVRDEQAARRAAAVRASAPPARTGHRSRPRWRAPRGPPAGPGAADAAPTSRRGTTSVGRPLAGTTSIVSRSSATAA